MQKSSTLQPHLYSAMLSHIFAVIHNISLPLPSSKYTQKFVYSLSVVSVFGSKLIQDFLPSSKSNHLEKDWPVVSWKSSNFILALLQECFCDTEMQTERLKCLLSSDSVLWSNSWEVLFIYTMFYINRDFRLLPWSSWELRSSGLLHSK
jgi:hypothetical protein